MTKKNPNNALHSPDSPPLLCKLLLCLIVAVSGCGGHPRYVLSPVADTAQQSHKVNMLIATTRSRSTIPGELFTGERARAANFAEITVSVPPDRARKIGEVSWPEKLPANPATDFATLKAEIIDSPAAKAWLNMAVKKTPDGSALVFIHGFNTKFEDSVYRFAQIVRDSRVQSAPILVTWPSRGNLFSYGYDRESTNYTRNALEQLFQYLATDQQVKEVSILAHSMGNWLTLEALRQMAIRNGGLPRKFKNVMLAAPDVDVDVFRSQIVDMGDPRPQFTLFVSRDDKALAVSRRVWGDVARLGSIDPEAEPYKQELAEYKIIVIDLTKVKAGDKLNHSKFAESPQIVQLIGTRISNGQTLTDSRVGLRDTILAATTETAAAAGNAAGLVLAAPVAVVDADSRDKFSNRVEAMGPTKASKSKLLPDCPASGTVKCTKQ